MYYPLDLNPASNPFLLSWWPLALGDPALFHVSLQTACLDEELLAQRGFGTSDLLMADSVALLRRKLAHASLAVQDGTMDSVITLAAIEFGKGNGTVARMHVEGVKQLIRIRGGINSVRQTSPLTARMVSWVSMLVMGHPQFETQDDAGMGDGIPPIPEWMDPQQDEDEILVGIDSEVRNVFIRLRGVFHRARTRPLPSTRLHDLVCFIIHRLLSLDLPSSSSSSDNPSLSNRLSNCLRHAIILYMFLIHGTTYFSHAVIMNTILTRFMQDLAQIESSLISHSLHVWLCGIGMVASTGTPYHTWFMDRARDTALSLQLTCADDALGHIQSVLCLDTGIFRPYWMASVFHYTAPV
ncbi:hypothetical protein ASPZODRAFT_137272 [Penicilliopsis zonata CBS 506.65]|uniref:Transcription factor domain-containing protein n=1 Tax=Penicilliopsis zonata CBS 506.65 TaxID=1073090 RepID=A0A1L9S5M1_9EURO|nr:hypothetical protein ASPZODRAFT_137272 [Penicilliopsis zonata CBS 506.65]OJJ42461.1 hypothetical protein ASPZODRAFT_137272 [Penicilliopsis zonata CBS 506.65]